MTVKKLMDLLSMLPPAADVLFDNDDIAAYVGDDLVAQINKDGGIDGRGRPLGARVSDVQPF